MRPIKLVLSAFGPYAKEEVIDFSLLNGKNIFLITGATGAGKTTIFDAISYALFGEASGSSRENDSLRSDFAASNRLTFVELDFELRGELYHIKRIPQQMKLKVKGEGFTHQGSEAELVLPDGKVRTGTGNVTNKINELLGINKEQFKQIVMLPQGEFKKLLLADSKDREVIFRKIFGTYTYEKIQTLLNEKAKNLYKDLEKSKDRILMNVKNIKSEEPIINGDDIEFNSVVNKIEKVLNEDKVRSKQIEEEVLKIREIIEKLQLEKVEAVNNNNLIKEKQRVESMANEMEKQIENVNVQEIKLKKIKKAKDVLFIEEELLKLIENKENKKKVNEELIRDIKLTESKLETAKNILLEEEGKEDEKNKLIEFINSLNEKKPKILEFDEEVKKVAKLQIDIEKIKDGVKGEQESLEKLKKSQIQYEEKLNEVIEFEKKKIILEKDIEKKEKLIHDVRNLYKAICKLKEYNKQYNNLKSEFKDKEIIFKNSKLDFEMKQEIYMKEQAGILASMLRDGEACPVCGSKEHPSPAKRMNNVPTEIELKDSQNKYENIQREYNELLINMAQIKSSREAILSDVINKKLDEIGSGLSANVYHEGSEEEVLELGKELNSQIKKLNLELEHINIEISNKQNINKELLNIKDIIQKKEKIIIDLNDKYTNIFALLKTGEEKIRSLEKEIPNDIKSTRELEKRILNLEEKLDIFNKSIKAARDKVNELSNILVSEKTKFEEGEKILSEVALNIEDKKQTINKKIYESGFVNHEEYDTLKEYVDKIDIIENKINEFREQFKSLVDRKNELVDKTKTLEIVDINDIENKIINEKNKEVMKNKEAKDIYSILTNNMSILKDIKAIYINVEEKEEKYKVIGNLSNLANGKKSPYISFERFVLASYFQEIIDSANLRLCKMTAGRFILKRKEDKGKGTAQQGLELEVFDNYTGKCRHVKTLSGGESFKASLSLALGLSDVVQANAGGISLDTIFIDEGFGTLDSESLDNAINSLIELQKGGRLVGIISHVPELKERIEAKLEIKSSVEGSSTEFSFD